MKRYLTKIFDSNWFFLSLLLFTVALPLSQALVSIASGVILFVVIVEGKWENKLARIKKNKIILFIPFIFLIYFLGALLYNNWSESLYDIRKTMFYLVLPLAFLVGKEISATQKRYVFYFFSFAIVVSTIIAFFNWKFSSDATTFSVHNISLISHIRFSFQLILVFWFFILLIQKNYRELKISKSITGVIIALYFLSFLLFQQSLTGIISFITSSLFFILLMIFRVKKTYRIFFLVLAAIIISLPVVYVSNIINQFYNIEKVDPNNIDKVTAQGNSYHHDFDNPLVENGHYVHLFVCEKEMRKEWNKRSEIKYDSLGPNGFPIHATLMRYLTSKGLRKDAEGVKALTAKDILNVEHGIANVIFQKKHLSLYPRIYQTVWEYYVYTKTGYANNQSFSQRIEYAKAALTIIKNHLWLGVGPGNWKEEFKKAYKANHSSLDERMYASSHNQYLNYMVKFGVIGFVLILFFLIYPIIKTRRYTDYLFLLFLVFMFFSNFADSNFETHMGSSFFVFFYCLFVVTNGKNYLKLSQR
jgi:hypothetical protein